MTTQSTQSPSRERFSTPIICPSCGQSGAVLWEESVGRVRPRGPERKLILLLQGFGQSRGKTQSGDPQIVCDLCGGIVAD